MERVCLCCRKDISEKRSDAKFCCRGCKEKHREDNNLERQKYKKEYSKEWYDKHKNDVDYKDGQKKYNQEYNKSEKGIEKRKKYHSNWYNKHKDESSLRCKKYRVARAEDLKEYNKQWRLDNIQEESLKDSEYAKKHPDKIREKSRRRRAKKLEVNEIFTSQDERFVYNLFNNECFNCKNKDNLCIDHVRPLSKGNALTVKNACVLCVSCNSSKGDKCPEEFYTESRFIELMNVLDTTIKEKIKENI